MSKIPSQVEEAAALAEKLHQEMFSPQPEKVTEDEDEIVDEDPVKEEIEEEVDEDEQPVPHDDDIDELRKFKSRYLSLQGKYNAEVPRLQTEIRDLKQSVFEKLTEMAKPVEPVKATPTPEDDVLARLREDYGEDFIDGINKLAEQIAERKVKASLAPVEEKVTSVEDTQIKVAQENFVNYLDGHIEGDWQKCWNGEDPKFQKFMEQTDPSGLYTYGELIALYNDKWDADKLVSIFNLYFKDETPVVKEKKPNPEREALVAPSRVKVNPSPKVDDKPIWTMASIKEFEKADRQGKYSPEESKAKWDDLLAAASEGRIRG